MTLEPSPQLYAIRVGSVHQIFGLRVAYGVYVTGECQHGLNWLHTPSMRPLHSNVHSQIQQKSLGLNPSSCF